MQPIDEAMKLLRTMSPQEPLELERGMTVRLTTGGIPVVRVHYSSDPDRDPEINPDWKKRERATYTSQADWDREQEIIDDSGGGELVFAETLRMYWDKIVITDPAWRPDPRWRCEAGFDHGKTNPTYLGRFYIDHDGIIYACGEYYQPGFEVWQNAPWIKKMADIRKISRCLADPTIFQNTMQQSQEAIRPGHAQEKAKSINALYCEQGIELFAPYAGDKSDISWAGRVMMHWQDLDTEREPTFKIVCSNFSDRPQYGLHNWSSPNLLWELMRRRRTKLTASQLMTRNRSEALVDKDNHACDGNKYFIMTWPEPTVKTRQELAAERTRPLAESGDLTSANVRYLQAMDNDLEYWPQPVVRHGRVIGAPSSTELLRKLRSGR